MSIVVRGRVVTTGARANNNFNALRIFAVMVVIYGNGFILTGDLAPGLWGEPFALIGLHMLFATSGFLLADSWQRDSDWLHYAVRRSLRLLPSLVAGVLLTVLVIGPIATRLSLRFYVLNGQTLQYLVNILLVQQRTLPGVFEGQPWGGSVNPMLWTLLAGTLLAVSVPFAAATGPRRPIRLLACSLVVGGLSQFLASFPEAGLFQFLRLDLRLVLAEAPFFIAGIAWQSLDRDKATVFRADVAVLCFLGNWFVASWWGDKTTPLLWLTIPYMVACFGRLSATPLDRLPNISYGMYLIAFPVQQLIVSRFPNFPHPIVACTVTALIVGAIFWLVVDRPILQLMRQGVSGQPASRVIVPHPEKSQSRDCSPKHLPNSVTVGLRSNNFDALRVFAALLVIYGHGCDLVGAGDPGLWGVPLARIGLDIFFSISGFLVTISWEQHTVLETFMAKRALRIFPGLVACVLFTAFFLGPAVSELSLAEYLSNPGTYRYLFNLVLYTEQYLPGVFTTMHHNPSVNGSLWSLFPEWLCYLSVPLFGLLKGSLRLWALLAAALVAGGIGVLLFLAPAERQIVLYNASLHYVLVQVPLFLVGGLLGLMRERPRWLGRPDFCLLFLTLNYGVSTWFGWWSLPIEWLTMPYMVVSVGLLSLPGPNKISSCGDFSYGLYLYAFPVQQFVLCFLPGLRAPILACTLVTSLLAFLSWHLVEKPALRLKPKPSPISIM